MITHYEASCFFDRFLSRLQEFVAEEGFIYPTIILLKKKPFEEIEYEHPIVAQIKEGTHITDNIHGLYRLNIALNIHTPEDDNKIHGVCKDLVRMTNAEAAGIVMGCLYREVPITKDCSNGEIYRDPETIKVVSHCYYLKDDPQCYMRTIPYVDRGEMSTPVPGEKGNHEVLFLNTGWFKPSKYDPPRMPDPFNRG